MCVCSKLACFPQRKNRPPRREVLLNFLNLIHTKRSRWVKNLVTSTLKFDQLGHLGRIKLVRRRRLKKNFLVTHRSWEDVLKVNAN